MKPREKINAMVSKLVEESNISRVYLPIVKSLIEKTMRDITDEQLLKYIADIRDEFIPWLLEE